jgi:integrase/recombinase XerD
MTPIAPHISAFLQDYLAGLRDASQHTCDNYSCTFLLLFEFASKTFKVTPSQLRLEQIGAALVISFLEHLETVRGNTASTRNTRLAAIKSFFHFLEYRLPAALNQIRGVLAIPFKKTTAKIVPVLTVDEAQALLDTPDPTTRDGIRDRAMLHLAVTTGLRVSELVGLRMDDLILQPDPSIRVLGKGRRERSLPLQKTAASALRAWLSVRGNDNQVPEVFLNARGQQLTRWGFNYILKKHAETAASKSPSLSRKKISPHVLRHTCAMIVLNTTHDIRKVALWLGHAHTRTSEIYTRADPSEKLEIINAITPPTLRKGRFRPPDKLVALLKGQSLCGVIAHGKETPMHTS